MPETGESTRIPVAGPVGMLLAAVAADEFDDVVDDCSVPLSQAVRPTIATVDIKCTHEFFLNCCLDFIKLFSF